MSHCQGCGRTDMAGITHVCPPFEVSAGEPFGTVEGGVPLPESMKDIPLIPRPAHGVSPCFVNCGQPACQKLGCVRVYNADHGWPA